MSDVLDTESAYMEGKAEWEEFLTKFIAQYYAPQIKSAMRMILTSLSPEERSQVDPRALSSLEKFLGGRNANSKLPQTSGGARASVGAPTGGPPAYNSTL